MGSYYELVEMYLNVEAARGQQFIRFERRDGSFLLEIGQQSSNTTWRV